MQAGDAAGQQFVMSMSEARSNTDLGYEAGALANAQQAAANASAAEAGAWGSAISGVVGVAGNLAKAPSTGPGAADFKING
jgi:hypothetical protein